MRVKWGTLTSFPPIKPHFFLKWRNSKNYCSGKSALGEVVLMCHFGKTMCPMIERNRGSWKTLVDGQSYVSCPLPPLSVSTFVASLKLRLVLQPVSGQLDTHGNLLGASKESFGFLGERDRCRRSCPLPATSALNTDTDGRLAKMRASPREFREHAIRLMPVTACLRILFI